MVPTDPVKFGMELAETLRKLIEPFSGPVLAELGSYVADKIRYLRFKNSIRTVERARQLLSDNGFEPRAVDAKLLVPILESAGLENDDELIEKWSGLLASASSGGTVLPSFIRILAELSSDEVRSLEYLADHSKRVQDVTPREVKGINIKILMEQSGLAREEFSIRVQNLDRLGLIEQVNTSSHRIGEGCFGDIHLDAFDLTGLGRSLISACRGPKRFDAVSNT